MRAVHIYHLSQSVMTIKSLQ